MQDARKISGVGLLGLVGALLALTAVSLGLVGLRVGIWLFMISLGIYGVVLGVGHFLDRQVQEQRQRTRPRAPLTFPKAGSSRSTT